MGKLRLLQGKDLTNVFIIFPKAGDLGLNSVSVHYIPDVPLETEGHAFSSLEMLFHALRLT